MSLILWIQLCDKQNLTLVDCGDKILLNFVLKNVIKLAKGSFQDSCNKILSQQSTDVRFCLSQLNPENWRNKGLSVCDLQLRQGKGVFMLYFIFH